MSIQAHGAINLQKYFPRRYSQRENEPPFHARADLADFLALGSARSTLLRGTDKSTQRIAQKSRLLYTRARGVTEYKEGNEGEREWRADFRAWKTGFFAFLVHSWEIKQNLG